MSRAIGSGQPQAGRPFYARMLRLSHIQPGWLLCVLLFEGAIALGALTALAEITSWWSILVLPVVVAVLVKAEDLATGARHRSATSLAKPATSQHRQPATPAAPTRHRAGTPSSAAPFPAAPFPPAPVPTTTTWRAVGRVRGRASVPGRRRIPPPRTTP